MANLDLTFIGALIDRSGSMESIKTSTEQAYSEFIAEQRGNKGDAVVTLAEFDNQYNVVYKNKKIKKAKDYKLNPRGSTALNDSIVRIVSDTNEYLDSLKEDKRPGLVTILILTDGYENSSKASKAQVKALIEAHQAKGWVFTFLAANQDAVLTGAEYGFAANRSLSYSSANVGSAIRSASGLTTNLRSGVAAGASSVSLSSVGYSEEQRSEAISMVKK